MKGYHDTNVIWRLPFLLMVRLSKLRGGVVDVEPFLVSRNTLGNDEPQLKFCNTPHVTCHNCNSDSCHFRLCDMFFPPLLGLCIRLLFSLSCISYHVIMCIAFAYVFISCIRAFPRCLFCILALRSPPVIISIFLSCVGIKHFQIGPSLAKRPWFTTGRPPVKFCTIWTSFDTPTVN